MKNILELLYDLPPGNTYGQDSPFARTARIKNEKMEMLNATMTDEQKELLESYYWSQYQDISIAKFDARRRKQRSTPPEESMGAGSKGTATAQDARRRMIRKCLTFGTR